MAVDPRMAVDPVMVGEDPQGAIRLTPLDPRERQFDESWLQKLLFAQPPLVPVASADESFGTIVPLAREFPTTSGYIDLLFVSPQGSICIVETKLWRNPEAHREVLAQVLDYARSLAGTTFSDFKSGVEKSLDLSGSNGLERWVEQHSGPDEFDSLRFEEGLRSTLATGSFLLLIVGDLIRPDVVMLTELIETAPNLEFSLALVEMGFYHLNSGEPWPLVVVPRVVGRTREVTRAVIKIRYEQAQPEVEVTAEEEQEENVQGASPQTFLASLAGEFAEVYRPFLDRWASGPCDIVWGKVGFSIRYAPEDRLVTIIDAYPEMTSLFLEKWLPKWGNPVDAYREYRDAVSSISEARRILSEGKGRYASHSRMDPDDLRVLLEATDRLARRLVSDSQRRDSQ